MEAKLGLCFIHFKIVFRMCFILGELEKEKETFIECELCAWHWAEGFFTRAILFNLTTIL